MRLLKWLSGRFARLVLGNAASAARQVLDREGRDIEAVGRQRDADDGPVSVAVGPNLTRRRAGDMRRIRKISQERVGKRMRIGRCRGKHEK